MKVSGIDYGLGSPWEIEVPDSAMLPIHCMHFRSSMRMLSYSILPTALYSVDRRALRPLRS